MFLPRWHSHFFGRLHTRWWCLESWTGQLSLVLLSSNKTVHTILVVSRRRWSGQKCSGNTARATCELAAQLRSLLQMMSLEKLDDEQLLNDTTPEHQDFKIEKYQQCMYCVETGLFFKFNNFCWYTGLQTIHVHVCHLLPTPSSIVADASHRRVAEWTMAKIRVSKMQEEFVPIGQARHLCAMQACWAPISPQQQLFLTFVRKIAVFVQVLKEAAAVQHPKN